MYHKYNVTSEECNYGILEKIQLALSNIEGDASREEFRLMREVLKGHDGNGN